MAYFAAVDAPDAQGLRALLGFYSDAMHQAIPPGAVPLTDAQYVAWVQAQSRMVWNGSALVAVPPPVPTVAGSLAALDTLRQQKQSAGVMFQPSGAAAPSLFATDDASQAKLLAEYVAASSGLRGGTGPWKAADGSFVVLSDNDVKALAAKARAYVVACYAREQALAGVVAASPAADITQNWPSNQ